MGPRTNNCHVWFSYFYYKTLILIFIQIHCPPVLVVHYICTWKSVVTERISDSETWRRRNNPDFRIQCGSTVVIHCLLALLFVCASINAQSTIQPLFVYMVCLYYLCKILLFNVFLWLGIASSDI